MAEIDDDKGFGDFMFAPSMMNRNNPINDNDDWSDFISHTQTSKSLEPVGFFSGYGEKSVGSESDVEVKPRGALPLSMFGEADEYEDLDPSLGGEELLFGYKNGDSGKNMSNLNPVVGINDLIATLYSQNIEIKLVNENGVDSNTKELSLNGLNSDKADIYSDLNDNFDDDDGWEFKGAESETRAGDEKAESDLCKADSGLNPNFTLTNLSRNGVCSDSTELYSSFFEPNLVENGLNSITANGSRDIDDDDDDGWGFKIVESESLVRDDHPKVDGKGLENAVETEYVYQFDIARRDPSKMVVASDGNPQQPDMSGLTFNFNPSYVTHDGIISESESKSKHPSSSSPAALKVDSDENFWEFTDAISETKTEHQMEEQKNADISPAGIEELTFDDDDSHGPNNLSAVSNGTAHNSGQWDFGFSFNPSSEDGVFWGSDSKSKENDMAEGLSSHQNVYTNMPTSTSRSTFRSPGSNTSIHDLISSLYGQAEQNSSVNHPQKEGLNSVTSSKTEMESDSVGGGDNFDDDSWEFKDSLSGTIGDKNSINHSPVQTVFESNIVNTDNFDNDSWEFKDAISGARAEDQASAPDHKDALKIISTKEQNNYVNLYHMLKDELCFIAQCHLEDLKKAQSLAAEDTKIKAFDEEIREFCNELSEDIMTSQELHTKNGWQRNSALNELLEVLQEPLFQMFESEYDLARRLSLAEKDSRSAIELLKHALSTLKILTVGSMEDQSNYVSTWYEMISVCAKELKHGASIWELALQKNVHSQVLSEPQGKRFMLALGEIYRVIEVLGASAKLYQPWILSSADHRGIFNLLSECYNLWLSSGMAEALQSMCNPMGSDYDGTIKALLESIRYIHDLDALALQNHVLHQQEPTCCLSVLTPEIVPGMKMIVWNGEHYFLTLANMWANLLSRDPPKLPHRNVG